MWLLQPAREPGCAAASYDGAAPGAQWQFHSSVEVGTRVNISTGVFHVGALHGLGVPAYTRADARVEIKVTSPLSLIATGANLFDPAHQEYGFRRVSLTPTVIPRSGSLHLVWRF